MANSSFKVMTYLSLAALTVSGLAAILGVRAATIVIRNNLDEFINDLQRQSGG
jgi:hypothetical protein